MNTDINLDEIRQRAERATPGPWFSRWTDDSHCMNAQYVGLDEGPLEHDDGNGMAEGQTDPDRVIAITYLQTPRLCHGGEGENTEFIAHARTDIPALCDEIERLRGKVAELELWKSHQRCVIVAACGRIMLTGVKINGDGMLDAVDAVVAEVERLAACEKEASTELHRLAKDLGLPDEGPMENRVGAVEMVERLKAENAKLRETISHFVKKYDECDPYIASAFFLAYTNRGGQYTGPTFKDELGALRALANGGAGGG